MKQGNAVNFSTHSNAFLLEASYCPNPECNCQHATFTFTECLSPEEAKDARPIRFNVFIDLEKWEEVKPPARNPYVGQWVEEFVKECPLATRQEYREGHQRKLKLKRRRAEYKVKPADVFAGELVSYSDLINDEPAMSSGGRSYFERCYHDDHEFFVEDLYCVNPECDCEAAHLFFWEFTPMKNKKDSLMLSATLTVKLDFDGSWELLEHERVSRQKAKAIFKAWFDNQEDTDLFEYRYKEVKEVGKRSVKGHRQPIKAAAQRVPVPSLSAASDSLQESTLPSYSTGRNEACPCGSGRKFKKCCGSSRARLPK